MVQRRQHPRFTLEARDAFEVVANASGRTLMATSRLELHVRRPIHLAHAARTEVGRDVVMPEACSDHAASFMEAGIIAKVDRPDAVHSQKRSKPTLG